MTQQIIELGEMPSGIGGDTNRSANVKCNENFTELYDTMAAKGDNSDITSLSGLTTPLSVEQGGTGATTAEDARASLGSAQNGRNVDISELAGLVQPLSVSQGGTGSKIGVDACRALGALALGVASESYSTILQNGAMPAIQFISDTSNRERGPLTLMNASNRSASCVITFHRVGDFACYFGLDTDNQLKVGGWSMGKVAHRIYHEGNTARSADGTLKAI